MTSAFQFHKGFHYFPAERRAYFPFWVFAKEWRVRTGLEFPSGSQGLTQKKQGLLVETPTEEGSISRGDVAVDTREENYSTHKMWSKGSSVANRIH